MHRDLKPGKVLVAAAALAIPLEQPGYAVHWIGLAMNHAATIREDYFVIEPLLKILAEQIEIEHLNEQEDIGKALDLDSELTALSGNATFVELL